MNLLLINRYCIVFLFHERKYSEMQQNSFGKKEWQVEKLKKECPGEPLGQLTRAQLLEAAENMQSIGCSLVWYER